MQNDATRGDAAVCRRYCTIADSIHITRDATKLDSFAAV